MEGSSPLRLAEDGPPPSIGQRVHSAAASLLSLLPFPSSPKVSRKPNYIPNPHPNSHEPSTSSVLVPFSSHSLRSPPGRGPSSPLASAIGGLSTGVRIDRLRSGGDGGGSGPAFVGQVFTMVDPAGVGLVAVETGFDIPFLTKRIPDWVKNMFKFNKHKNQDLVFRFFLDLNDAVSHVRHLKIATGMLGACRLDVAYGHFKENPHMFQFVPNSKQVKEANNLLKASHKSGRKKLDGVPVFSAQNLNIAIATQSGIKWYTPYFFDKNLLDNILEDSVDQHFHTIIQIRHGQRRRDVMDDDFGADVVEESGDSIFEPPEVQEVLEEMGHPEIPLSVMSKVAEIQLLDVVDRVILGNRWLRKATGIQPKFPYLVDTFESRSAASLLKAKESTPNSESSNHNTNQPNSQEMAGRQGAELDVRGNNGFRIPFMDWLPNPWLKPTGALEGNGPMKRLRAVDEDEMRRQMANPLLPKITMVGISTAEVGKVTKASLKKTMDNVTRELEQEDWKVQEFNDKDPLFVANVGDYSAISRMSHI